MKKIIRLTESDLHNIIKKSVNKILNEDVLGNDFRQKESNIPIYNNYEPFESQKEAMKHNFGVQGEKQFDPTYYDTHLDAIGWNDDEAEGYGEI